MTSYDDSRYAEYTGTANAPAPAPPALAQSAGSPEPLPLYTRLLRPPGREEEGEGGRGMSAAEAHGRTAEALPAAHCGGSLVAHAGARCFRWPDDDASAKQAANAAAAPA